MSRQNILCRDKVWPNEEVLCCDRAIVCRDIVGQAERFFYHDRGFLCRDGASHDRKLYRT